MEEKATASYKRTYSDQERDECLRWFKEHMDELPQTMELPNTLRAKDLPATVRKMTHVLSSRSLASDGTYSGFFYILLRIRSEVERLKAQ